MSKRYFIFFFLLIAVSSLLMSCGKKCPASCNDRLACTKDYCDESTGFLCEHEEIEGCFCGNGQCEEGEGENKCTCESDCGQCTGDVSEYVEYRCVNDQCVTATKQGIDIKPISKINNYNIGELFVSVKFDYEDPINTELTRLGVTIQLEDLPKEATNVKITKAVLKDDANTYVSETKIDKKLAKVGDSAVFDMSFQGYSFNEERNSRGDTYLMADIYVEYQLNYGDSVQQRRMNYPVSFGPVKFIKAEAGQE